MASAHPDAKAPQSYQSAAHYYYSVPEAGHYAGTAPVQYGAAVPPTFGSTQVFVGDHDRRLMDCYGLGRGIKLLALIDGFFLILNCIFSSWALVILSWGPVAGYLAGSRYQKVSAIVYMMYYIMRVAGDAFLLLAGFWWCLMLMGLNLFIARYVYTFVQLLRQCSPTELAQLRSPGSAWSEAPRYFGAF